MEVHCWGGGQLSNSDNTWKAYDLWAYGTGMNHSKSKGVGGWQKLHIHEVCQLISRFISSLHLQKIAFAKTC